LFFVLIESDNNKNKIGSKLLVLSLLVAKNIFDEM